LWRRRTIQIWIGKNCSRGSSFREGIVDLMRLIGLSYHFQIKMIWQCRKEGGGRAVSDAPFVAAGGVCWRALMRGIGEALLQSELNER
jgi:hypothetical protein